ncbi:hypothetical protein FIBSPDRAFT_903376 [Athelia psychrophila]|uniref:Uncharacterized protein n=1 Tax=Athelia psychrophila TaxID=1759441 RepID=A0A167W2V3_9AGAM|nr:hypothetical protein FIBSPDRAFT_903376 [Fibularhizoctonia sp. CBS 109695]
MPVRPHQYQPWDFMADWVKTWFDQELPLYRPTTVSWSQAVKLSKGTGPGRPPPMIIQRCPKKGRPQDLRSSGKPAARIALCNSDSSISAVRCTRQQGTAQTRSPSRESGHRDPNFRLAKGYESAITVNAISPSLLFFLCLPKLKRAAQKHNIRPTATIVPSETHTFCPNPPKADAADGKILDALSDPHRANMATRYPTSKRLEIIYVRAFAGCIRRTNTACPAFCHSQLAREAGWGLYIMKLLLARGTDVGSHDLVYVTQYAGDGFMTTLSTRQAAKRFWDELVEALEKISPGVTQN